MVLLKLEGSYFFAEQRQKCPDWGFHSPASMRIVIALIGGIPWQEKGLTYSSHSSCRKTFCLRGKIPFGHGSDVAWSQQEPFQLQRAVGSMAAWVCWLNGSEWEVFSACAGWGLIKCADFHNVPDFLTWAQDSVVKLCWAVPARVCSAYFAWSVPSANMLWCSRAWSHMWQTWTGVRDALRCVWDKAIPKSLWGTESPRHHSASCSLSNPLSDVLCRQHFRENLCV